MPMPKRSRHNLTRCRACRAHIQAGDRPSTTARPFCGANLAAGGSILSAPAGRGGILAASLLAFSATGCGSAQSEEPVEPPATTAPADPVAEPGPAPSPAAPDQYDPAPSDDGAAVAEYGVAPAPDDQFSPRPPDDDVPAPRYGLAPSPPDGPPPGRR